MTKYRKKPVVEGFNDTVLRRLRHRFNLILIRTGMAKFFEPWYWKEAE